MRLLNALTIGKQQNLQNVGECMDYIKNISHILFKSSLYKEEVDELFNDLRKFDKDMNQSYDLISIDMAIKEIERWNIYG